MRQLYKIARALELLAVSHILEKMAEPLQELYRQLRDHYTLATIELVPEDGVIQLTFPDGPSVRVTMTKTGRFRVKATRDVGKRKPVEEAKTAQDARQVLYVIDGFLVGEAPGKKKALKLNITGPTQEGHVYSGRIAEDFVAQLGSTVDRLSSPQMAQAFGQFIRRGRWTHVDQEGWREVARILGSKYHLNIEPTDLESALDQVGRR